MDMQSEFFQIESAPEAQEKTVLIIPDGLLEIKCNAHETFQQVMDMGIKWVPA